MQTHKQYVTHIMADTTNNISDKKLRLTIRICKDNMAFSVGDPQESGQLVYEPYHMNAGISIAANLREAFHVSELLQSGYKRVLIELDAPVMLVPTDEYAGQDIEGTLSSYLSPEWERGNPFQCTTRSERCCGLLHQ